MNLIQKNTLVAAAAAITLASGAFAAEPAGLIGTRHVGLSIGAERIDTPLGDFDAGTVAARLNMPVAANFDFIAMGSFGEVDDINAETKLVGAGIRIHSRAESVTPFVDIGFGYADNGGDWDEAWLLGAGFEWVTGANVVTVRGEFQDGDSVAETWIGAVELFRWINDSFGVGGQLSYADSEFDTDSVGATISARFRF